MLYRTSLKAEMKIVVVGGVAGGMSFAARARRLNESAEIIRMFNSAFDAIGARPGDYYPPALREEIARTVRARAARCANARWKRQKRSARCAAAASAKR